MYSALQCTIHKKGKKSIQDSIDDGIVDSFDIIPTYRLKSFVELNKLDNVIMLELLAGNLFCDIVKVLRNEREKE